MKLFSCSLLACVVLTGAVARANTDSLTPSAALSATFQELAINRTEQRAIAGRYLAQAQKENSSDAERFALAELYFVALKGAEARAAFQPFLAGKDLRARLAWQRLMRMTAVIDSDFAKVEQLVSDYRKEFPADLRDPYHTYVGTQALVNHHKATGNHRKVVEVIMAEIDALPPEHPCYVASLIGPNFASFQAADRTAEAVAVVQRKGALLRQLAAQNYRGWPADEVPRLEEIANPQTFFQKILSGYERSSTEAPKSRGD